MKKIAFIVDVEDWAFDNIAKHVKYNLQDKYEIDIIYGDYVENIVKLIYLVQDYDLVHFFWRGYINLINNDFVKAYVKNCGLTYDYFKKTYYDNLLITTAVCDHLFLNDDDISITKNILKNCNDYLVISNKLFDIYQKFDHKPKTKISDGVDTKVFKPTNKRIFNQEAELVIGWAGNSAWGDKKDDTKGINTILKPAINELIKEGYKVKMHFADSNIKKIPHNEMPKYYSSIDVLMCTSSYEGTPIPVLEAMASGVPVISTDVGVVSEVFGKKQKEYILKERSIKCVKDSIIKIYNNRKILEELSNENISSVKQFDWKNISKKYDEFFDNCIKEKKNEYK